MTDTDLFLFFVTALWAAWSLSRLVHAANGIAADIKALRQRAEQVRRYER